MAVTVERAEGDLCRVAVEGEMTIYSAQNLKVDLLELLARCGILELDLSGVSEIDSAGLQLLIMVKTAALAQGRVLNIVGHSQVVLEVLDLCDLEDFFGDAVLIYSQK